MKKSEHQGRRSPVTSSLIFQLGSSQKNLLVSLLSALYPDWFPVYLVSASFVGLPNPTESIGMKLLLKKDPQVPVESPAPKTQCAERGWFFAEYLNASILGFLELMGDLWSGRRMPGKMRGVWASPRIISRHSSPRFSVGKWKQHIQKRRAELHPHFTTDRLGEKWKSYFWSCDWLGLLWQ